MFTAGHPIRFKENHSIIRVFDRVVTPLGTNHPTDGYVRGQGPAIFLADWELCLENGLGVGDCAYDWRDHKLVKITKFRDGPCENVRVTDGERVYDVFGSSLSTLDQALPILISNRNRLDGLVGRINGFQTGKLKELVH